jgi:hypothetical protein
MTKKLLNATKIEPYSPEGTFSLKFILDECVPSCVNSTSWSQGKIYDPKNGKTYSCKMTLEGNELKVRGYVGFSLLGRTTVWTRKM